MNVAKLKHVQPKLEGIETLDDGAMVIGVDVLARFGNGSAKDGRQELRLMLALDRDGPVLKGPTARPETVRVAGPADEEACLELWLQDLKENAEHVAPIDEAKVLDNIRSGTRRRGGFAAVIDGPDGKPIAITVLHPMQWHWGHGWFFQEMVTYVHKDHRRSKHVDDLLDFQKWVSDEQSKGFGYTVHLLCGVLGAWRIRAKMALYRRKFQLAGGAFVYPAPPLKGN